MEIELTDMAPTGEAIGRDEGMIIFVPLGLPGERVEVEVTHRRRNYARARLVRVLRAAPERVEPRCPYFGACGGCEWQHASVTAQLAFKTRAVREQFRRIGKFDDAPVLPCIPSPVEYGYRNHTQFVLSSRGRPGYYAASTKMVVEVEECPISNPAINQQLAPLAGNGSPLRNQVEAARAAGLLQDLRELHLRTGANTGERMIVLERNDGSTHVIDGPIPLHEEIGELRYAISPASFFQINTPAAELLVREVLQACELGDASEARVLELYCGVGLFTLPLSLRASHVLGIEASPSATADAAANLAGHANARVITGDVAEAVARRDVREQAWDIVVADPPRAGIEREALSRVIALGSGRIVYVSCDPATLARDARVICDGGYLLMRAQPLDMFPQTHHVETVATFEKKRAQP
jgi:23S rRNA (uracil1939-C5)-methyltransferase